MNLTQIFVDHAAVDRVASRARVAQGALALTLLNGLLDFCARAWSLVQMEPGQAGGGETQATFQFADLIVHISTVGAFVLIVATPIVFLQWVHGLVASTRALDDRHFRWTPSDAVWAFIIPFVSLVRPYHVMRDAYAALEPDALPPPAPQVTAGNGYRGVTVVEAPLPRIPTAFIGLWWGAFLLSRLTRASGSPPAGASVERIVAAYQWKMFSDVVSMIAAALAIVLVRSVTARLLERRRRIASAQSPSPAG
ncbi:MAG: hypothetical protein JWM10_701 [Myxococcaceae bacterium]|nr:hypothetical protein [Myxococcaceae bacterium]